MSRYLGFTAVLAALLLASSAADGFGGRWRSSYSVQVYYPAPVYVQPIRCVPIATAGPKMYAIPTPAPATQTKEPPVAPSAPPKLSESYYYERHYSPTTPVSNPIAKDVCRVGFWNVSGRDLNVTIAGRTYTIARDRSLTLELGREFTWQIEQRVLQNERIPEGRTAHEVIIRS